MVEGQHLSAHSIHLLYLNEMEVMEKNLQNSQFIDMESLKTES